MTSALTLSNLTSVKQFIRKYPAFTLGGMRQLIFNEHTNGLAGIGAVVRVGRKVLIHEDNFIEWIILSNKH